MTPASASTTMTGTAAARASEAEVRAGYAALNSGRLHDAELRFKVVLARDPESVRGLEGLGLLRLRQSDWAEAAKLLQQAEQRGASDPALRQGLEQAQAGGAVLVAEGRPRPASPGLAPPARLSGDAGQRRSITQPATAHVEALSLREASGANARGGAPGQAPERSEITAPATSSTSPKVDLSPSSAAEIVAPPPTLNAESEMLHARTLATSGQFSQAADVYRQILSRAPENSAAWTGLITALHQSGDDPAAVKELQRMPQGASGAALAAPDFAVTVASIDGNQGRSDAARQVLESFLTRAPQRAGRSSLPVQLALAELLLREGRSAQAYAWFRTAVATDFGNVVAWAGLLASLQASGHDREAIEQIAAVPAPVRLQLESNASFLEAATRAYAGVNDRAQAIAYWGRLQRQAEASHVGVSAGLALDFAQWLAGAGDEEHLYPALMSLGGRSDLSDHQRRAVQRIWAGWARRQAVAEYRRQDTERAKLTLTAAADAFSDNPEALRIIAGGFDAANQPKAALALFKAQDLSSATAEDLTSAVDAALGMRDNKDAESWLRNGLGRFRNDSDLMMLASRYEQATGHARESAAYLQAALARSPARPQNPPTGAASPRVDVASAETPGGLNAAPNLAEVLAKSKASEKSKASVPGATANSRPYLPSFATPDSPRSLSPTGGPDARH